MKRAFATLVLLLAGCAHRVTPAPISLAAEVVKVPEWYLPAAKDALELSRLLNSEVRNADVRKGWVDYAARVRMARLMKALQQEWALEVPKPN